MTLFQHISMWSLRALLLWGVMESGAALYASGTEHWTSLQRLGGHRSAMARLEQRATAVESELHAANAELIEHRGAAWRLSAAEGESQAQAAARQLRETLLELGAEAPVVDGEESTLTAQSVSLTARWREPSVSAPQVLQGLAQRHPAFAIERLSLENTDTVTTEIVLTTLVTTERAP